MTRSSAALSDGSAAPRFTSTRGAFTAWTKSPTKGGTGRPVPLLTHFVLSRAK